MKTEYNTAPRKFKRNTWRRHSKEVEQIQVCSRVYKLLSKETQISINSLKKAPGLRKRRKDYKRSSTVALLHKSYTETLKKIRNWQRAKEVIDAEQIKWTITSFEPYKSPGPGSIYQPMLQKRPKEKTSCNPQSKSGSRIRT